MTKVFLFNGPPRSGKDYGADQMYAYFGGHRTMFKAKLFELCASALGITVDEYLEGYDDKDVLSPTGWHKDLPKYQVGEYLYSQRTWLIHMSEVVIKPVFGECAFGELVAKYIDDDVDFVFVSDSGFADEAKVLIDKYGRENVFVVRIHKDGCTFAGDSRRYLEMSDFEPGVKFFDVFNAMTEYFANELNKIVESVL